MSETAYTQVFQGTVWEDSIIQAFAEVPTLIGLIRNTVAPQGAKTVKVPLLGALVATKTTVGSGASLTPQVGANTSITVTIDDRQNVPLFLDDADEYQDDVGRMAYFAKQCVTAIGTNVNREILDIMADATLTGGAVQRTETALDISDPTTAAAKVGAEINRLITMATIHLDTVLGPAVGDRMVWLDGWLYRLWVAGSDKQLEKNVTNGFAAIAGGAVPYQGCTPYNVGVTKRYYSSSTTETDIEFYVLIPDVAAIAPQQAITARSNYEALENGTHVNATMVYGLSEAYKTGLVRCTVTIDGAPFGTSLDPRP